MSWENSPDFTQKYRYTLYNMWLDCNLHGFHNDDVLYFSKNWFLSVWRCQISSSTWHFYRVHRKLANYSALALISFWDYWIHVLYLLQITQSIRTWLWYLAASWETTGPNRVMESFFRIDRLVVKSRSMPLKLASTIYTQWALCWAFTHPPWVYLHPLYLMHVRTVYEISPLIHESCFTISHWNESKLCSSIHLTFEIYSLLWVTNDIFYYYIWDHSMNIKKEVDQWEKITVNNVDFVCHSINHKMQLVVVNSCLKTGLNLETGCPTLDQIYVKVPPFPLLNTLTVR